MKSNAPNDPDDLRKEYDFDYSAAVRGKYYHRLLKEGASVAVLEPVTHRLTKQSGRRGRRPRLAKR